MDQQTKRRWNNQPEPTPIPSESTLDCVDPTAVPRGLILPLEVIQHIFQDIYLTDRNTALSVQRSCHLGWNTITPLLYRHVHFDFEPDQTDPQDDITYARMELDQICVSSQPNDRVRRSISYTHTAKLSRKPGNYRRYNQLLLWLSGEDGDPTHPATCVTANPVTRLPNIRNFCSGHADSVSSAVSIGGKDCKGICLWISDNDYHIPCIFRNFPAQITSSRHRISIHGEASNLMPVRRYIQSSDLRSFEWHVKQDVEVALYETHPTSLDHLAERYLLATCQIGIKKTDFRIVIVRPNILQYPEAVGNLEFALADQGRLEDVVIQLCRDRWSEERAASKIAEVKQFFKDGRCKVIIVNWGDALARCPMCGR